MARILTAIVFLPILFSILWLAPPVWFAALAGLAILLGLHEYFALSKQANSRGLIQAMAAALAILAAFYFQRHDLVVAVIAALVTVELLVQLFSNADKDDFSHVLSDAAIRVFGVLYVVALGGYIVSLTVIESPIEKLSAKLLSFFFIVVFAGDTGAYFTGRAFGRRKLAPKVSPGKTVEGLIGGLAGNIIAALIIRFTFFPELKTGHAVALAFVMGLLGVTGDLCESMLKRGAKAKDAGKLIPGHGGLLDRLDSMVFNAPLLYYFYQFFLR